MSKEIDALRGTISMWESLDQSLSDLKAYEELIGEASDEDLLQEAAQRFDDLKKRVDDIEFRQMLSGPHDKNDAIFSINAGAGGTESCDWAEILLRMYRRWAERHGYQVEILDFTHGDQAGFRSVTMTISGNYVYGYLRAEIGVHRLVRISPFDANKRRHTSFASVFVMPDIEDEIEIEVKDADLRVDTFRSSGAGGQHVNKTDSAVRLTHLPTNIVVACQSDRSQHRNRAMAMKLLKAKLYELEMEKKQEEQKKIEGTKKEIAWGSQIRSYVLHPYQMVKDHRTQYEVGNAASVLDGDLDAFIRAYLLNR
ncbi:MAG: peptide chain release factor 2 [Deltaproteobacteria bacterium RIFCSPLOWO2_02_FULL_50_16]|nr:MAG: peptide chain release factor 2 [Deltaproteobacteria bacterium RIFCSPHIGHO2_02_FULL_50_15]OGQ57782.1 MAG: peptide chain release factor 2 [Deltaproteobacteria bacterium RIFCSPLOWO2_02_FULL_50_16]OGQ68756.1 MAG: peptide chain release factor 2 [Deltaproteobacteria bacterium RIFCSPLOWO2_12_FULL_50_11]